MHYATRGDSLESQTDTDPATVKHPGWQERQEFNNNHPVKYLITIIISTSKERSIVCCKNRYQRDLKQPEEAALLKGHVKWVLKYT